MLLMATSRMSGLDRSCWTKPSPAIDGQQPVPGDDQHLSLRKPKSILRAKSIWVNTTAAAIPRPMDTENCRITRALRNPPEPGCPALLPRKTIAGRKPDSTKAG